MGTEPYEPIHIALCFKLMSCILSDQRHYMLQRCSPETLARMLAVLYSASYQEHEEIGTDDEQWLFGIVDEVMGMLISKLDTSGEPF